MHSAWKLVIKKGFGKIVKRISAPFVVPFLDEEERKSHPVYGVADATDLSWWNIGVRNACRNYRMVPAQPYSQWGNKLAAQDWTLENLEGFQKRWRLSKDGQYISFRATWGKPRKKGKREFYIGWKMDKSADVMVLTFFQFRPFF